MRRTKIGRSAWFKMWLRWRRRWLDKGKHLNERV